MKLLGIDWGERRIGFAFSEDPAWVFPWKVVSVRGFAHAVQVIQDTVRTEHVDKVILGLPLGMASADTPQTGRVREVAADLSHVLPVPVELVDERMSSQLAARLQHEAGKHGEADDAAAAAEILRTYLAQQA